MLFYANAGVAEPVPVRPNDGGFAFVLESPDINDVIRRIAELLRETELDGESPTLQPEFEGGGVARVSGRPVHAWGDIFPVNSEPLTE